MSTPKNVLAYEAEWGQIAQILTEKGNFTLPCKDKKKASHYRLRFYGFRRALATHDAANPWVAPLMETQATITAEGDLHFERAPLGALLRGLLEHTHVSVPGSEAPAAAEPGASRVGDALENTLLNVLQPKLGDGKARE